MKALELLLLDLRKAAHLASQFTGGYSGEYLSAEAFHTDLAAAIEKLQAGDTYVLRSMLGWFAPTCQWDDLITEGGVDLGDRIYEQLIKLQEEGLDR